MGLGIGNCCCGGCNCCNTNPTGIAITWGVSDWGSVILTTSFVGQCNPATTVGGCFTYCDNIGTPTIVLDYTAAACSNDAYLTCATFGSFPLKYCFVDHCNEVSEPACTTQCCFVPGSFDITFDCFDSSCGSTRAFTMTLHVVAQYMKFPGEDSCRLVITFWLCQSAGGSDVKDDSNYGWTSYRSAQLSGDCCTAIELDFWSEGSGTNVGCAANGFCSLPPATITVTPLCPDGLSEDCLYQGDGSEGWTLVSQGTCIGPCAPPAGTSTGTDDFENGTCGDGEGGGV